MPGGVFSMHSCPRNTILLHGSLHKNVQIDFTQY